MRRSGRYIDFTGKQVAELIDHQGDEICESALVSDGKPRPFCIVHFRLMAPIAAKPCSSSKTISYAFRCRCCNYSFDEEESRLVLIWKFIWRDIDSEEMLAFPNLVLNISYRNSSF